MLAALVGAAALGLRLAQALSGPPEGWPVTFGLYWQIVGLLVLLLLAGALAYRALAAFTLSYELDRNGLYIIWLGNRAVVPLDQIQSIDLGVVPARMPWRWVQGIGYYWGQGRTADGKRLHLFATQPPERCLLINARDEVYAISPEGHDAFVQDLEQRRNLGATQTLAPSFEPSRMFLYSFWNDSTVRGLLLVAFVLNLLVLGVLDGALFRAGTGAAHALRPSRPGRRSAATPPDPIPAAGCLWADTAQHRAGHPGLSAPAAWRAAAPGCIADRADTLWHCDADDYSLMSGG